MLRLFKPLLLMVIPLLLVSCLKDEKNNCGIYLEFIYDYNMEYANSFDPQVNVVDIYVFDEEGKFLFSQTATCDELIERKKMWLNGGNMPFGIYRILAIGGLCDKFYLTDKDDNECSPNNTCIEDVKLALVRQSSNVSHEFPHLWFSKNITEINYQAEISEYPVYLIKDTNNFHVSLTSMDTPNEEENPTTRTSSVSHTFEIVTPEGAVYSYQNEPILNEKVTYTPWLLEPGSDTETFATAKINTCRLFCEHEDGYRLIVRNINTNNVLWSYDLMKLLAHTKPANRPDGTDLPIQEYLDRQSEWNISILYKGNIEDEKGFVAIGVRVNGWIVWLNDIEF